MDVKIVYHASGGTGDANREAIANAGIAPATLIERTNAPIAHNKFIVFGNVTVDGALQPASVWTGSTNFTEGAIYGHSNVGHIVRDAGVASSYLVYWQQLALDQPLDDARRWGTEHGVFPPDDLAAPGIRTVFSPRHGYGPLRWYAERFGTAGQSAQITGAFGLTSEIENALLAHVRDAMHYVLLDKRDNNQDAWSRDPHVFVSVGTMGGPSTLRRWAQEQLTGFNVYVPYLHTKILLVDPLTDNPTTVTGSANFSPDSTNANDENMLVIQGDTDVADIYFTEYARIFNHFYARFWASQLTKSPADAETASYLDETTGWQTKYFVDGNPKQLQRQLYCG